MCWWDEYESELAWHYSDYIVELENDALTKKPPKVVTGFIYLRNIFQLETAGCKFFFEDH